MAEAVSPRTVTAGVTGSVPGRSMLDVWWTKWHCDRFFFWKYFRFLLSVLFQQCSAFINLAPSFTFVVVNVVQ